MCFALTVSLVQLAVGDSAVNKATQNDKAFSKYGLTGKRVIVAFLDRGIDYTHPDFINTNGTTRIKMMWDMSNANPNLPICDPGQPAPIVYTQTQINQALQTHTPRRDWPGRRQWPRRPPHQRTVGRHGP